MLFGLDISGPVLRNEVHRMTRIIIAALAVLVYQREN